MELITRCSVEKLLQDNCHQTRYTRKKGLKNVVEMETELQNLLQVRLNHIFSPDDTICLHHEQTYIYKIIIGS